MSRDQIGVAAAFTGLVDLVAESVGGTVVLCSDDFFAGAQNLVRPGPAVWDADRYTERGKWMDGWESRRRRVPGHDWCILKLGVPGVIRGVDIDTAHFTGNHAPWASIDACVAPSSAAGEDLRDGADWVRVVPEVALKRGSPNLHATTSDAPCTHVRLNIYPDGGVARLRLYGEPSSDHDSTGEIDLASVLAGGRAVACSDAFFSPMQNLVAPGRSTFMGGGWETRRSRPPGLDWIIVRLGSPGEVEQVVLETHHFKGNYPDQASVEGLYWPDASPSALTDHPHWAELVPMSRMGADAEHTFTPTTTGPFTHLRLRIRPDGGISRLRAFGRPTDLQPCDSDPLLQHLNRLSGPEAGELLVRCCGAARWVLGMVAARPFTSRTHLLGEADQVWWHLGDRDWLEAFAHHPRIGADVDKLREGFAATAGLSAGEQAGVAGADEATLRALAEGNITYEQTYGHIFIVCASGLTAAEMLNRLHARLDNDPQAELRIAAGEQAEITKLRLTTLEVP